MCGKYSLTKFTNFLIIVLYAEIATTFGSKMVAISIYVIQKYRKFAKFESYVFCILQDFVTKFWNFTTFERFFPAFCFFVWII